MQSVIGNSLITSLRPAERPYEVRDIRLKGLLLRVQPSGVMTYYVEFARGRRMQLGRVDSVSPTQARERAKEALADVYKGKDPRTARRDSKKHTLGSFIDEVYAPWADGNIRTAKATVARLRASFAGLLGKPLADLTPYLIENWRLARQKQGVTTATINRDLDDLRSSLAKARAWGLTEADPMAPIKRGRVDSRAAVRFLTNDEEIRLRAALEAREAQLRLSRRTANAWRLARGYALLAERPETGFADRLKPMVLVSLHTGLRQGELFSLAWADIDFLQRQLTIHGPKAKSGQTRHVPLNDEALDALRRWQAQAEDRTGLVFPAEDGGTLNNVRRSWMGVLKAAGITKFRWHDLRHSFASRLVMAGVDLNTVIL